MVGRGSRYNLELTKGYAAIVLDVACERAALMDPVLDVACESRPHGPRPCCGV